MTGSNWKSRIGKIPWMGPFLRKFYRHWRPPPPPFPGTAEYWTERYRTGGNSGAGSYGRLANFKAEILNQWVASLRVRSVIEFGGGDGHQLGLARYPEYLGFDLSPAALELCRNRFADDPTKRFSLVEAYRGEQADLTLSLDVIFHLIEDEVFDAYMRRLFQASRRWVVIYSSNHEENHPQQAPHVRHRRFTDWIEAEATSWMQEEHVPNRYPPSDEDPSLTSFADFFLFRNRDAASDR